MKRKTMIKTCIPTVFAFILTGMYSVVDGLFIGNAAGDTGLAAINIAWPIQAIITACGIAVGTGGSILFSEYLGKGKRETSIQIFYLARRILFLCGMILTMLLIVVYPYVLKRLGAQEEVLGMAEAYCRIIICGGILQIAGAGLVPFLRNMNMPVKAMIITITGMFLNMGVNYYLIFGLKKGIRGAAFGTIFAQGFVCVMSLLFCGRYARTCTKKEKLSSGIGKEFLKKAISPFGVSIAPSLVLIYTNLKCLQYGGNEAVACYAVISYIVFPVQSMLTGVGEGVLPLLGFCYGAGKVDDLKIISDFSKKLILFLGGLSLLGSYVTAEYVPFLFGMSEKSAVYYQYGIRISALAFFLVGIERFYLSYFNAVGHSILATNLIYLETIAISPILLYVLPLKCGINGIWISLPCTYFLLLVIIYLILTRRK